jgi:vacuolar-type H+-ATPase subunit H
MWDMPTLRDILRRWRPATAPGAAARAGVPDSRPVRPAQELAGVFHALESVQIECRAIRDAAARDARRTIMSAEDAAVVIVADARTAAEHERADVAAETTARGEARLSSVVADAKRQAAQIAKRAAERMPCTVAMAAELVKEELRRPRPHP